MAAVTEEFGGIDLSAKRPFSEVQKGYTQFREGDVIVAKITPCMENGKLAIVPPLDSEVGYGSTEFHVLRAKQDVSPDWLAYFVAQSSFRRQAQRNMSGSAGQLRVPVNWLKEQMLPLAPPNEQTRIVSKIEELFSDLDAGVAALERARANLKRYRAAVLKAAVEGRLTEAWRQLHPAAEPAGKLLARILAERRKKWEAAQLAKFAAQGKAPPEGWKDKYPEPAQPDTTNLPELPKGWCWATVDQLAALVRNGFPEKPASEPPGFPILRINAVRPMSVDLSEVRYLNKKREQVSDYFLTNGDLLFTRYNGSIELLGVSGMVRNCNEETLHPDKLIRVKTVLASPLPEFIEVASNVGHSRKHIQSKARTTAGQTGVSGIDIKETPIPLCSLEEQQQILHEIDVLLSTLSKSVTEIGSGISRASRLRQSILKRAFEGKLVPQDPNDEPASALLARIRAARAKDAATPRAPGARKGSKRNRAA
jgi:type I restriction enzyme S subunit